MQSGNPLKGVALLFAGGDTLGKHLSMLYAAPLMRYDRKSSTCLSHLPKYPRRRHIRAVLCPSHKTARQGVFAPKALDLTGVPNLRLVKKR